MSDIPNPAPEVKAKPKAEKPPALEELPFEEFINAHYLPALSQAFVKQGVTDLQLEFANYQVRGLWAQGLRQFTVYFSKADINAQKAFSCADAGRSPSTIEPFLIDERKAPLALLVFGVIQRLTAQKWLTAN
ncbi:DUF2996 domain-containing protein [Pseudanabaena sp. FACHB-1277]|jgi:hypothetical protein|uniref:DUF2996 domain-containing protein n=1 Tax=Pseudanabaena cinerea FACHB-1277 TaxID=2949581 RepID=A0A926Z758_9CYAN|nr:DUF2996 domain-containing protein [Pseudanabaena cinerea]MBD2151731.1 DUF2996 domain-containing protein [Pseudanabaena cinerea FACHB-1277]